MKKGFGRRAAVRKCKRADIHAVKAEKDFQCTLHLSTEDTICVGFATKFEVNVLVECLKPNQRKSRKRLRLVGFP